MSFFEYDAFKSKCNLKHVKEEFIKSLTVAKPFKIPIPNYQPSANCRSLGIKRDGTRQPLHDPEEENALLLYSPPILSQEEMLKADKYKN